ncbi:MAG: tRNA-(ms[2]io[6]A)-hydroxylase [Myxococcales bacterium]|nr:tRNA-(ms[2]io[6]A)-hydroxylase [Myxococcota bacterium]MDW8282142.1 tRNA-(ms[2]io[6]A)-hydroxylase [Myxococcales bacterium]
MLHLAVPTAPDWVDRALANLNDILLDHAHCEKRAAATAVGLIFRYPEHPGLMGPLSRLAREELAHFEEVLAHLSARGLAFRRLPPSPYAGALVRIVRTSEPHKAVDTLLCCALIEARSCERMQLLAAALERRQMEPELCRLYRGLLQAEARHHQAYLELALSLNLLPAARVRARLAEIAEHEAQVLASTPREPRLHNA